MKKIKLLHIFYIVYVCLFNYSSMFGMDSGYRKSTYDHGLLCMPKEIVHTIIHSFQSTKSPISVEELTKGVMGLIQFRSSCKEMYGLLPDKKIRELCKNYKEEDRDKIFEEILNKMNNENYNSQRASLLSLIYAGVNPDRKRDKFESTFLQYAMYCNDVGVTKILLEFGANFNQIVSCLGPIIFGAQSVEIAELLRAKGANVHCIHEDKNILEKCLNQNYPSDLMKFYMKKCKVDATIINKYGEETLWHKLVFAHSYTPSYKNSEEKINLLFQKIPHLINQKNKQNKTPLDLALKLELVQILQSYGAKTSAQLEEEEKAKK